MGITLRIIQLDITDFTVVIIDGQHHRIDKSFVRSKVQMTITFQHFGMKSGIDFHGITLHQLTGCLEITFTLDALYLSQQTGNQ